MSQLLLKNYQKTILAHLNPLERSSVEDNNNFIIMRSIHNNESGGGEVSSLIPHPLSPFGETLVPSGDFFVEYVELNRV